MVPRTLHCLGRADVLLITCYINCLSAYLERDNTNAVILVDWSILAAFPYYKLAAAHTEAVGKFVGEIINLLVLENIFSPSDVHIIGMSDPLYKHHKLC